MGLNNLEKVLSKTIKELKENGRLKGKESIITKVKRSEGEKGPRYFLKSKGAQEFIRMNSNSYLGMSLREEVIQEEERVSREFGVGPGAVRFISGTFQVHRELEKKLAAFHQREDAMLFSSAYSTVMGILTPLITPDTIVISDELNHNCIINALKLSRPKDKKIYKHLDMNELEERIKESIGLAKRLIIITDGIFSMRGDYAPLNIISNLSNKYDQEFPENILLVVDDSHGIGAYGKTGRGTEEYTRAERVDLLVGTLGKAFGVNGGYITSNQIIITYLRETAPMYIYSNPISPTEASAALKSLEILDSESGISLLVHLQQMTKKFENGLLNLGYEIIESDHPIVPLMVRDTKKTSELVSYLVDKGILSTGLNYPVVPKGDEEIRFQVNADHTPYDIDYVLNVLKEYKQKIDI
ncbi:MAG TPA: aminotransferase class I/II-fold pyridoxal phosphate-dependent enzyme [Candidatus Atribacteria bacterium]|nr:aminotransferase class I/II-fold pyridoxal phosphate-dependent enzyme [Candidatus Atribacteria bacterium]